MLAALKLEALIKKIPGITKQDLIDFYRSTYKEAFNEGRRDARSICGCQPDDID